MNEISPTELWENIPCSFDEFINSRMQFEKTFLIHINFAMQGGRVVLFFFVLTGLDEEEEIEERYKTLHTCRETFPNTDILEQRKRSRQTEGGL